MDKHDLFAYLKDLQVGKIETIRYKTDKSNEFSGKAFVQFYLEEDAQEALRIDRAELEG